MNNTALDDCANHMRKKMIKQNTTSLNTNNKIAYFGLLGLSMLLIVLANFGMSASMLALSIVFYPFDVETRWPDKKLSQKLLILGHLAIAVILSAMALYEVVK